MKKYYNLELSKIVSVTGLKTVEKLKLDKEFFFPTESHSFYEFVYVLSGEIYLENNDKSLSLNAGEFRLTFPNVAHRYFTENDSEIFIVCFKCKSNVLSILDQPILIKNDQKILMEKLIFEIENSFKLPFEERVELKKDAPIGAKQITENIIEELLIRLLRDRLDNSTILSVKNKTELQSALVNDIVEILKENVYKKISLSKICKSLFYSSTYLNNVFKEHKHVTIMKYYNTLKIEESKRLLLQGISIQEISDKLCFDTPNYFTKTFKSITGLTPSKYRQKKSKNK